jgi:hypothetical protein
MPSLSSFTHASSARELLTGLGRLPQGLGCIFMRLGLGFPSLRRLLPDRCMDNVELVHFSALLG